MDIYRSMDTLPVDYRHAINQQISHAKTREGINGLKNLQVLPSAKKAESKSDAVVTPRGYYALYDKNTLVDPSMISPFETGTVVVCVDVENEKIDFKKLGDRSVKLKDFFKQPTVDEIGQMLDMDNKIPNLMEGSAQEAKTMKETYKQYGIWPGNFIVLVENKNYIPNAHSKYMIVAVLSTPVESWELFKEVRGYEKNATPTLNTFIEGKTWKNYLDNAAQTALAKIHMFASLYELKIPCAYNTEKNMRHAVPFELQFQDVFTRVGNDIVWLSGCTTYSHKINWVFSGPRKYITSFTEKEPIPYFYYPSFVGRDYNNESKDYDDSHVFIKKMKYTFHGKAGENINIPDYYRPYDAHMKSMEKLGFKRSSYYECKWIPRLGITFNNEYNI